jgi:sugar-specific transcriptional regulator TrmB
MVMNNTSITLLSQIQNNPLVQILFVIAAIATIISVYLGWKQYTLQKKGTEKNIFKPHRNVEVLKGRDKVVAKLSEITSHATKGQTIFGHCNTCANYPNEFYSELTEAVGRGVKVEFIIRHNPDSERFLAKLKGLRKENVDVYTTDEEYIRLFGIKSEKGEDGGELIFAIQFEDDFIGIYIKDKGVVRYMEKAFKVIKEHSKKIEL